MEEELISQHCAMAGCFYCMHNPPNLGVLHWLWEVTPSWIHTLEAVGRLSSQYQFWDMRNFLIHAMDDTVLIDAFINRLKGEEIKKSQASPSERWIQTCLIFIFNSFFSSLFFWLWKHNLTCTKKKLVQIQVTETFTSLRVCGCICVNIYMYTCGRHTPTVDLFKNQSVCWPLGQTSVSKLNPLPHCSFCTSKRGFGAVTKMM